MNKNTQLLTITLAAFSLLLTGCKKDQPQVIELKEFEGITFSDATFAYDGNEHSISVENAPSFATVTYSNNNKIAVGKYKVSAKIEAEEYITLNLYAYLTIEDTSLDFENLVFEPATFEYDGNEHSIEVGNLPSFATVTYSNNTRTEVGAQTAKAVVTADGYHTATLTARLEITAKKFSGITFEDQTFNYDGAYHSIYVKGAPDFATVKYTNNNQYQTGSYTVTAKVSATGYETLTLTAKMEIGKFFSMFSLEDRTLIYDGDWQKIVLETSNLPSYTTVTCKLNGSVIGESDALKVKDVGTYSFSVTLSNEKYGYKTQEFNSTISVINQNIGGVDASKTAFNITKDVKFQTLKSKILESNFTIDRVEGDEFFYKDGTTKKTEDGIETLYFDGQQMFGHYSLYDRENNSYDLSETTINSVKVVGDELLSLEYNNGVLAYSGATKMKAEYFEENFVAQNGLVALAYLSEGTSGEILPGSEGGYTTTYGTFTVDEENNKFIVETRNHYYHEEWDHDEVVTYTLYNIGNTKINMIDAFDVQHIEYEKYENSYSVIIDGIKYYNNIANISFDAIDVLYVERKAHILLPIVNEKQIKEISYEYYEKYYGHDLTGFELDLYIDNTGYYQGDYAEIGYLKYYGDIRKQFGGYGGTYKYYDEW